MFMCHCLSSLVFAKCFPVLYPSPPPSPINYVVSTLGSTDMLACENSHFSLLIKLHCFSFCLRMTDKRQKATKVKFKCDESVTKQSIFVEYVLL